MTETAEKTTDSEQKQPTYEPVMDLDTVAKPRDHVRIRTKENRDGELYEIRSPREFGIEDEATIRAEVREYSELVQKDERNSGERKKLKARLRTLLGKILIAPDKVQKQVLDRDAQAIVTFFTTALFAEDAIALERAMAARDDNPTTGN